MHPRKERNQPSCPTKVKVKGKVKLGYIIVRCKA